MEERVILVRVLSKSISRIAFGISSLIISIAILNFSRHKGRSIEGVDATKLEVYEDRQKSLEDYIKYIDTVGDRTAIDTIYNRVKSRLATK